MFSLHGIKWLILIFHGYDLLIPISRELTAPQDSHWPSTRFRIREKLVRNLLVFPGSWIFYVFLTLYSRATPAMIVIFRYVKKQKTKTVQLPIVWCNSVSAVRSAPEDWVMWLNPSLHQVPSRFVIVTKQELILHQLTWLLQLTCYYISFSLHLNSCFCVI